MRKTGELGTTTDTFQQGLDALHHFRSQMTLLSDAGTLALLGSLRNEPFTNGDAREILLVRRQASWKRLAQLVESGLIQKRGHSYRIAPFTNEFVSALSSTFTGVLTGKSPTAIPPASRETLVVALEGLETLYAKGRLSQADFSRHKAAVEEMIRVTR